MIQKSVMEAWLNKLLTSSNIKNLYTRTLPIKYLNRSKPLKWASCTGSQVFRTEKTSYPIRHWSHVCTALMKVFPLHISYTNDEIERLQPTIVLRSYRRRRQASLPWGSLQTGGHERSISDLIPQGLLICDIFAMYLLAVHYQIFW